MYIRIALFSVLIIKTSVIELEYMELRKWFINNVANTGISSFNGI